MSVLIYVLMSVLIYVLMSVMIYVLMSVFINVLMSVLNLCFDVYICFECMSCLCRSYSK
jgi:hypothetical protein